MKNTVHLKKIILFIVLTLGPNLGLAADRDGNSHGGGGYTIDRGVELIARAKAELLRELDTMKLSAFDEDPTRRDLAREGLKNLVKLPKEIGTSREGEDVSYYYQRDSHPYQLFVYKQFYDAYAGSAPERYDVDVTEIKRRLVREFAHLWHLDNEALGRALALEAYPIKNKVENNICEHKQVIGGTSVTLTNPHCNGKPFGAFTGFEEAKSLGSSSEDTPQLRSRVRANRICKKIGYSEADDFQVITTWQREAIFPNGEGGWEDGKMIFYYNLMMKDYPGRVFSYIKCVNNPVPKPGDIVLVAPPAHTNTKYWLAIPAHRNVNLTPQAMSELVNQKAREVCAVAGYSKYEGGAKVKSWPSERGSPDDVYDFQKKFSAVDISSDGVGESKNITVHYVEGQTLNPLHYVFGFQEGDLHYPVLISGVYCK